MSKLKLNAGKELTADIPDYFLQVFAPPPTHNLLLLFFNLNLQGVKQSNSSDCGIFVIHFSRMFLKDPDFYSMSIKVNFSFCKDIETSAHIIQNPPSLNPCALWHVEDVPFVRAQLRSILLDMGRDYLNEWIQKQGPNSGSDLANSRR
jgi:hypothetical protein